MSGVCCFMLNEQKYKYMLEDKIVFFLLSAQLFRDNSITKRMQFIIKLKNIILKFLFRVKDLGKKAY